MTEQETVQGIINWLQTRVAVWNANANIYEIQAEALVKEDRDASGAALERQNAATQRVVAAVEERIIEALARGDWKNEPRKPPPLDRDVINNPRELVGAIWDAFHRETPDYTELSYLSGVAMTTIMKLQERVEELEKANG